jgi:hypothetical protein
MPEKVFLLSPANCSGKRAALLFNERATFDLAVRMRSQQATLGEVFCFLSGLYFRGKLAYARAFEEPTRDLPGHLVITPSRGLLPSTAPVDLPLLREFAATPIVIEEPLYRLPLERDVLLLASQLNPVANVVLLGSVATAKYVDLLLPAFGERLLFPAAFVGRGDMSRGGLLLRCVEQGSELDYLSVATAVRRGTRPPKLPKRT